MQHAANGTQWGSDLAADAQPSGLRLFEHRGLEAMPLQELVKLRPVSLGQGCCLGHITPGDLQEPDKIVALELLARLFERRQYTRVFAQCSLHQGRGNHARRRCRRRAAERGAEDAHHLRPTAPVVRGSRQGLPIPGLLQCALHRHAPHPPLGQWRRDPAVQPGVAVPIPSSRGARGWLQRGDSR